MEPVKRFPLTPLPCPGREPCGGRGRESPVAVSAGAAHLPGGALAERSCQPGHTPDAPETAARPPACPGGAVRSHGYPGPSPRRWPGCVTVPQPVAQQPRARGRWKWLEASGAQRSRGCACRADAGTERCHGDSAMDGCSGSRSCWRPGRPYRFIEGLSPTGPSSGSSGSQVACK